jgi:nucleotide-binding universal stress UspA family protein
MPMPRPRLFRRVLVPHDFSAAATAALRVAADLTGGGRRRLIVLHVLAPFYTGPGFPSEQAIAWTPPRELVGELQGHLETLVARTIGGRAGAECRAVLGDPLRCILAAARGVDAIVMATSGRTGLPHALIGSVAEKVVRHSPVPVLTIRAGRAARRPRSRGTAGRRARIR